MSGTSEQIVILYDGGNKPEEIAEMLSLRLEDVLLILHGKNRLSQENIKKNLQVNAIITSQEKGADVTSLPEVKDETVEEIYKNAHKQVAKNLVMIATAKPDEITPVGVIAKVGMYINEEVTGRNEARAKKNNGGLLINIAEMLIHGQLANNRVNEALGIPPNAKEIPVLAERVA
jgi:hypothetical protein